ncbi:hypothetical protein M0R45_037046 [Rubus argutus]|uniref:Uncharacterized protein n=1 Tax=Rubus argutus TaxID=59490 RepID=A0AAW1W307_RUBAR
MDLGTTMYVWARLSSTERDGTRRITAESEPSLGSGNEALGGAAEHGCDVVENDSEHGLEREICGGDWRKKREKIGAGLGNRRERERWVPRVEEIENPT